MDTILYIGILAGAMQILGYYFYLRNEDIEPNPVTWFMFAYGTAILTILEWDGDATLAELFLPTACAVLAIVVSAICWRKARRIDPSRWWPEDWWPKDRGDQYSFVSDIIITIGYVLAWVVVYVGWATGDTREWWVLVFLFLSNVSTIPAFVPIIRSTLRHPEHEHWLPWAIWTYAYALLAYVTYATHGEWWHPLMLYPALNAVLHGAMAVVAHPLFHRKHLNTTHVG
jgi:hypothetical protein